MINLLPKILSNLKTLIAQEKNKKIQGISQLLRRVDDGKGKKREKMIYCIELHAVKEDIFECTFISVV